MVHDRSIPEGGKLRITGFVVGVNKLPARTNERTGEPLPAMMSVSIEGVNLLVRDGIPLDNVHLGAEITGHASVLYKAGKPLFFASGFTSAERAPS